MAANYRFSPSATNTLDGFKQYALDNFRRIADAFITVEAPVVPTLTAAPEFPIEGQLVISDGISWDPGSGAGAYIYRDGAWRRID